MTLGMRTMAATGVTSRMKSKLRLPNSAGLLGVRKSRQQQRIAVRRCPYHGLGRDVGAGAGPVLDDERHSKPVLQPPPHQSRDDVVAAARRKSDHPGHRARRIGLRMRKARSGRPGHGAGRKRKDVSTARPHEVPSSLANNSRR